MASDSTYTVVLVFMLHLQMTSISGLNIVAFKVGILQIVSNVVCSTECSLKMVLMYYHHNRVIAETSKMVFTDSNYILIMLFVVFIELLLFKTFTNTVAAASHFD